MKRKLSPLIAAFSAMAVLILDSGHAVQYAAEGVDLCLRVVIPSLLPFFLLSIYLTGNLSGNSGQVSVLISGFLGGYPAGAQAVASLWRTGRISAEYAQRLLMFCSQAGPAFLFGMVSNQFPGISYAWKLWAIQILSALSVYGIVFRKDEASFSVASASSLTLTGSMQKALRAMASVCGWVIIFRVLLGYLSPLPLPVQWKLLLSGLLELTNGCAGLKAVENISLRFLLAAVMLNFGGLCVMLQTASVTEGLDLRYYLMGKLLQTGFSILFCFLFLGYYGAILPFFLCYLLIRRRNPAKKGSIPAIFGV